MARGRDDDDDDYDDDDDDRPTRSVKKKKRSGGSNPFIDFLMFRLMVAPWIFMILFWLGVIGTILAGASLIILAVIYAPGATNKIMGSLMGLGYMVLGPIVVRVYAEVVIVFFRIFDTLVDIKNVLEDR